MIRAWGAAAMVAVLPIAAAAAQTAPAPPAPPPLVITPPVPIPPNTGPNAPIFSGTYSTINRANVIDPAAAQRAQFAYRMALEHELMGDKAGAAAYAAAAQAIAGAAGAPSAPLRPSLAPKEPAPAFPPAAPSAIAASAFLPDYILTARDRIFSARSHGADVSSATRRLRAAVDAYLDGDSARSRREAHAATAALPPKR